MYERGSSNLIFATMQTFVGNGLLYDLLSVFNRQDQ